FMSEEVPSGRRVRMILALPEHDVLPKRVGTRADRLCGLGRSGISMNSHLAEVSAKAGLEKAELVSRQRLPSARWRPRLVGRPINGEPTEIVTEARRGRPFALRRTRFPDAGRSAAG